MTNEQFEQVYYPRYRNVIEAIARRYARDEHDLHDDLVSAGTIGLLGLEPSRARPGHEDAYLRNGIRNKIIDFLRWLNRRDFDRLDAYLHRGHDVVQDPVTGDPMFVHGDSEFRAVHPYDALDAHAVDSSSYATRRQRWLACANYDPSLASEES